MLYYKSHASDAIKLIKEQLKDGWTRQSIVEYWSALGYDYFDYMQWYREAIDPCGAMVRFILGAFADYGWTEAYFEKRTLSGDVFYWQESDVTLMLIEGVDYFIVT